MSPRRKRFRFHFTIQPGGISVDEHIFLLKLLHRRVRKKAIIVWDNLATHKAVDAWFAAHHPGWFHFAYLPPYSPELNPTESCWSHMKTVSLANFVALNSSQLIAATLASSAAIDAKPELIKSFFKHSKLEL